MFTQKCFIRKNTPELVKRLEELGYKASFSARNGYGEYLYAFNGTIVGGEYNAYDEKTGFIDCGTNDELFLAIASLRDDDISLNDKINEINKKYGTKIEFRR